MLVLGTGLRFKVGTKAATATAEVGRLISKTGIR